MFEFCVDAYADKQSQTVKVRSIAEIEVQWLRV